MSTISTDHTEILNAALALPPASRKQLAEELFLTLRPPGMSIDDPGLGAEIQKSLEAYRSGDDLGIDGDELMSRIRATKHVQS